LNGIGQIQVNPKIDLTFASGLRSIVRQDPDVILVGEIRDGGTAEIAIQSALTGHLVFSTLHTNDSASAITRLVDIGMEPFLLSSALNAIVAQRLVRTLCPLCREEYRPDANMINLAGLPVDKCGKIPFYRAKGCDNCFHTGYKGRVAIMEILVMDQYIKSLILKTSDSNVIKTHAIKRGMKTLRLDGLKKLVDGVTSIEEVLRVTHG
jgi:general secretion pathway protein E